MAIRVPGAMAGSELAALRMPADLVPGASGAMVTGSAFDGPPLPATMTLAVPAVAMRAAATRAVNWEAPMNVVTSGAPFHCTMELAVKAAPVTVRVTSAPPGTAELGLRLAREATGVEAMESASSLEETGPSLKTLILAVPDAAIKAADTIAVNCVALTRVVGDAAPVHPTDGGGGGGRGGRGGGGQRGAVPGHGGAGEEVAAVHGEGEIGAAHQYGSGDEAGDGRGGRLHGKNGRLRGNQRARTDHLDRVRPHIGNRAGGHADGELVDAHIGGSGSGQTGDLGGGNKSVAVHRHGEGRSASDGGVGTDLGDAGRDGNDGEGEGIGVGDARSGHGDGGHVCGGDPVDRYGSGQLSGTDEGGGERGAEP